MPPALNTLFFYVYVSHRLPRDNKRDAEQQTLLTLISGQREYDQNDPWQVVPRQVFTPYSRLLISTAFVVLRRVGCLGVTGVCMYV